MIPSLAAGMGTILIGWIVLFFLFAGVGLLPGRWLGLRDLDGETLLQSFWLGLCLTTLFLQLWHFVLPITWHAQAVFAAMAFAGLRSWGAPLRRLAGRVAIPRNRAMLVLVALVGAWLANRATAACCSYDTAMYDLPSILWIKTYPIVPGLGNLNERLAFGNSSYLFSALLDTGFLSGQGSHLANGLLMFVFLAPTVPAAFSLVRADAKPGVRADDPDSHDASDAPVSVAVMRLVLVAPAVILATRNQISSFNSGFAGGVLIFVGALEAYRFLAAGRTGRRGAYPFVATVAILAAAVAFKLNVAVFAALATVAVFAHWLRTSGRDAGLSRVRVAAGVALLCLAFGLAWTGRNIILSGYPVFPSRALPAPVDWRVPADQADALAAFIRHQGRVPWDDGGTAGAPADDYSWSLDGRWVAPWLHAVLFSPRLLLVAQENGTWSVAVPALLALVGLGLSMRSGKRRGEGGRRSPDRILVPSVVLGIGFWFVTAPQPRLGFALFWILAAMAVARLVAPAGAMRGRSARNLLLAGLVLLGFSPLVLGSLKFAVVDGQGLRATSRRFLLRPPPSSGLFERRGEPKVHRYVTSSGLTLWVPDGNDNRCWDAPLPCTPFPAPNIRLRKPGSLRHGFVTDGSWRAERWPNPWGTFKASWLRFRVP